MTTPKLKSFEAYVFSYSGFVIVEESGSFEEQSLMRLGVKITISPPIRLAPSTWRPIPQVSTENYKDLFPGIPYELPIMRLAVLPAIGEDGKPALQQYWGDDPTHKEDLPKDTFFVRASGSSVDKFGAIAAESVLNELFDWLRVLSRQWWIGRPTEAITGNQHLVVPLHDHTTIKDHPVVMGRGTTPSLGTLKVCPTRKIF